MRHALNAFAFRERDSGVRQFLERSGAVAPEVVAEGAHLLVVIDYRQARVYETEVHWP